MVARDDLGASALQRVFNELRELRVKVNAGFSSITRGALRIASNEGLLVEGSAKVSGWLVVTGTARVVGLLEGSGTLDWTGPVNLAGAQTVTGPTTFNGTWKLAGNGEITGNVTSTGTWTQNGIWRFNGDGDITGDVDVSGNISVWSQGKITVTGGSSPATLQNGKMSFGTGGSVEADTGVGGVRLLAGDAVVNAGSTASIRKGGSSIIVGANAITINPEGDGDIDFLGTVQFDVSTIPVVSGTGMWPGTLIIGTNGYLRRADGT